LKIVIDYAIGDESLPEWASVLRGLSPTAIAAVAAATTVLLVGISSLIRYLNRYLMSATRARMGSDMRTAAFDRLQHLSMRFHDKNRTGDLVSRVITDSSRSISLVTLWFRTVLPRGLTLIGMVVVMFLIDVPLAIAAVSVIPGLLWYAVWKRPKVMTAERARRDRHGQLSSGATDSIRNVRAVQAFTRQPEETSRFRERSEEVAESSILAMDVSARYSPISSLLLAVGRALVVFIGAVRVMNGDLTVGSLLVVLSYLSAMYSPIRSLAGLTTTFATGEASRDRLREIFAEEHLLPELPDAPDAKAGPAELEVQDVAFSYEQGTPVLTGVSFHARPGEVVCIVGPNGAGKSSLLSLILRFYDPESGSVRIGGTDVRELSLGSVRRRIALVPQDPWILDGTIFENIAFGEAGTTDEAVYEAARAALVDEFVCDLRDGYDTMVGEGGELLSGGQRRRIALARALIRDASVMLLDEPTGALDGASEIEVMSAVRSISKDRVILIVSHRLNLARTADRIVVLDRGRIVEQGSHAELLGSAGSYSDLWNLHGLQSGPGGAETANGQAPPQVAQTTGGR
jgi:subfamily B ATP-binding cassette protein MsbA